MTIEERNEILKKLNLRHWYALKFTGFDALGVKHTFVATIDAHNGIEAKDKAKAEMKVNGILISKFHNISGFEDEDGAKWQAGKWIELLKEQQP